LTYWTTLTNDLIMIEKDIFECEIDHTVGTELNFRPCATAVEIGDEGEPAAD
jgi:hypothetical protein